MSKDSLQSPKARKLGYSSQLAFVISLIAGSVGTGNIWRFPRVAAANGGAFVLAYIIMMFVVIIPVMMGEHFMGRRSRRGAPGTFKLIAGKKATWLGTIVAFIMAMTAASSSKSQRTSAGMAVNPANRAASLRRCPAMIS